MILPLDQQNYTSIAVLIIVNSATYYTPNA